MRLAGRATDEVPQLEQFQMRDTDSPLDEMNSTVLQLRADLAGIYMMLILTNGLIAALLAALIF